MLFIFIRNQGTGNDRREINSVCLSVFPSGFWGIFVWKKNSAKILIKSRLRQTVGDEVRSIVTILIIAQCTYYFVAKIVLNMRKYCSSDQKKPQKFPVEGKSFEINRRIQDNTIFPTEYFFNLLLEVPIRTNNVKPRDTS